MLQRLVQLHRSFQHEPPVLDNRNPAAIGAEHLDTAQLLVRNGDVCMAAQICFADICFSLNGNLIVPGNDFFSVRIIDRRVLRPALAGVAYCKVRSHLFRNQNRQTSGDVILFRCHICRGIGSDGELSHRQSVMVVQHIFPKIASVLFL